VTLEARDEHLLYARICYAVLGPSAGPPGKWSRGNAGCQVAVPVFKFTVLWISPFKFSEHLYTQLYVEAHTSRQLVSSLSHFWLGQLEARAAGDAPVLSYSESDYYY
jgi:hypothetical protein